MNWKQALALAAIMGVTVYAAPAHGDSSLPPERYDIGGVTEADTLVAFSDMFGNDGPPLIKVPIWEVQAQCNMANLERLGVPYPAAATADGAILLGCLVRDHNNANPIIIYGDDPDRPWMAHQILRHEIAHLLGWSGNHER